MNHLQAAKVILVDCAAKGIVVFDTMSLRTVFPGESPSAFRRLVGALASAGVLVRVVKGVYLGATAKQTVGSRFGGKLIGAIRPGCVSYLSLEYALAEWGSMSQIPQRWTLMTTGRRGEFHTPVGTFEFTHTTRDPAEILARTSMHPQLGARLAHPDLAWEDLRRTRRNLHLVDVDDHEEIVAEFRAAQRGEPDGKPSHAEGGMVSEGTEISNGRALLERGRKSEAVAYFAALRKRRPESARVHLQSAFVLDRLGREGEAVPLYERALSLGLSGTDARDAHVCLASSLRNIGRPQQAFDLLESAKSRFDGDVVFELFFALLATEIGRSNEAIRVLVKSLLRDSPAEDLGRYRNVLRGKFNNLVRASSGTSAS